jgi:hypothetical protein
MGRVGAEIVVITRLVFTKSSQLVGEPQEKQTAKLAEGIGNCTRLHPRAGRFVMNWNFDNFQISTIDFYFRLEKMGPGLNSTVKNVFHGSARKHFKSAGHIREVSA